MKEASAGRPEAAPVREQLGYITEAELFNLLNIAVGTGRNRHSAGTLPPCYKVGREKLYRLSEVDAWIRRRRVSRSAERSAGVV